MRFFFVNRSWRTYNKQQQQEQQ